SRSNAAACGKRWGYGFNTARQRGHSRRATALLNVPCRFPCQDSPRKTARLPVDLHAEADTQEPHVGLPERHAGLVQARGNCRRGGREVGDLLNIEVALALLRGANNSTPIEGGESGGERQVARDRGRNLEGQLRNLGKLVVVEAAAIRRQGQESGRRGDPR